MHTLKEELRALISEISEVEEISDTVPFKELGIDSMMGVEIVAAIERRYKIKIEDRELEKVSTLDSSVRLVEDKLGRATPAVANG